MTAIQFTTQLQILHGTELQWMIYMKAVRNIQLLLTGINQCGDLWLGNNNWIQFRRLDCSI